MKPHALMHLTYIKSLILLHRLVLQQEIDTKNQEVIRFFLYIFQQATSNKQRLFMAAHITSFWYTCTLPMPISHIYQVHVSVNCYTF